MKKINCLVTAGGGDIGQSIGKILLEIPETDRIICTDLHKEHYGIFIFHEVFVVPKATEPKYLESLSEIVERNKIDLVIPSNESEIKFFYERGIKTVGKAQLIIANDQALKIGLDKFETNTFLKGHGFPFPKSEIVSESSSQTSLLFPFILKARFSAGSANIYKIEDAESFHFFASRNKNMIAQEFIPDTEGEYTCALFRSSNDEIRAITLERKLKGGLSFWGRVTENKAISDLLQALAVELDLKGSINVQLRLYKGVPYVFEVNSRFSSTSYSRHLMGFQDVRWCVQDRLGIPLSQYNHVQANTQFLKGYEDKIIPAEKIK